MDDLEVKTGGKKRKGLSEVEKIKIQKEGGEEGEISVLSKKQNKRPKVSRNRMKP